MSGYQLDTSGFVENLDRATQDHATNALGTILATFDSEELARSWVRRHIERFPSLRVERVTVWIDRQVVYRPRPAKPRMEQAA